jgi:predicted site-specific integrase-resolvase
MSAEDQLLTDSDVADILQVSTFQVRRYIREDKIPYVVLPNGDVRFLASDICGWLAAMKHGQAKDAR